MLGVVRGSAVNQDGASNGLTAPSGVAQERVIARALAVAGVSGSEVDVVEGHGTGTRLGDPIEVQALLGVYGVGGGRVLLGSVKSNIGHTQAASGVAGVMKMVMAMREGVVPASLHVDAPSSEVDWSSGAVELVTEVRGWPVVDRVRRAGVSSFGVSGTNAHVIVEQAPVEVESLPVVDRVVPLVLSARSDDALRVLAGGVAGVLAGADPAGVGLGLVGGRAVWPRRAVVVGDRAGAAGGLVGLGGANVVTGVAGAGGGVVFVFPGQGSQWVGMGVRLLASSEVFAARMAECDRLLSELVDWSLFDVLGGAGLDRVDVVQPASFAVMVSLAALWESYGVRPDAVVGHSQGEIAAACVAGVLSLADAVRVVVLRSRVIAEELAGGGGMVSVAVPVGEAGRWGLEVAAVNGPASVVLAGSLEQVDRVVELAGLEGVRARRVAVDYASHSSQVETVRERLIAELEGLRPGRARVPFYSTVDNRWLEVSLDGEYWFRNLRQSVRFHEAVVALAGAGFGRFVEVSAHPVLAMAMQEALDEAVVVGTLRRDDGDLDRFWLNAAELWVSGAAVDWSVAYPAGTVACRDLPTYPFQHQRYWLEPTRTADLTATGLTPTEHPLLSA
ncbi:acyltransferase domain-containing protein, partial [Dactylosporangium sp. NPDC048998]|uniref:acyltransferase domain-containing protein n=1 Tax=Dactylosporangium sp. NPDC048998 TaxID=3363976 RepID=UPI003721871B